MQGSQFLGFTDFARFSCLGLGFLFVCSAGVMSIRRVIFVSAKTHFLIMVLIFCAFEICGIINNQYIFEQKILIFRLICYCLFASGLLIGFCINSSILTKKRILLEVFYGFLLFTFSLIALFSVYHFTGQRVGRASFEESSPVALGFAAGSLALCSLTLLLTSPNVLANFLGLFSFLFYSFALLKSGSRGSFICLLITVLLLCYLLKFRAKVFGFLITTLFFGFLLFLQFSDDLTPALLNLTKRLESLSLIEADKSTTGSSHSRFEILEHNLNLPGIFFLGAEGYDPEMYPHNFEVESIVRLGFLPGVTFCIFVIAFLFFGLKSLFSYSSNFFITSLILMGLFTFLNSQTNMMWEFLRPLWLCLGLAFGMVVAQKTTVSAVDR